MPHVQKFKRELSEKIAGLTLKMLGVENVKAVYYADLIGGAEASTGVGRDVDLIVWIEKELPIDSVVLEYKLNRIIFKSFKERLEVDLGEIVGPNIVEVHLIRDIYREPLGRLTLSSSTVIPIWSREGQKY